MIPRRFAAVLSLSVALASFALPVGYASNDPQQPDCVSIAWTNMVDQLRIIAHASREIALGFATDQPGEGLGFAVYVAPSVCTGLGGFSAMQSSIAPPAAEIPSYPALP